MYCRSPEFVSPVPGATGFAVRGPRFDERGFDEPVCPVLHDSGLYEARSAIDCALDFLTRKNEPIIGDGGRRIDARLGRCSVGVLLGVIVVDGMLLRGRYLAQQADLLKRFLTLSFPFGLKILELPAILFDGTVDALLIEGEPLKVPGLIEEGAGAGERGVDFGMVDVNVGGLGEVAEGQDVVFDGADTLQTPEVLSDQGCELKLERVIRLEAVDKFLTELVVRAAVFLIHDADLASDAMAQSIY
jgi:hypothetical protein